MEEQNNMIYKTYKWICENCRKCIHSTDNYYCSIYIPSFQLSIAFGELKHNQGKQCQYKNDLRIWDKDSEKQYLNLRIELFMSLIFNQENIFEQLYHYKQLYKEDWEDIKEMEVDFEQQFEEREKNKKRYN